METRHLISFYIPAFGPSLDSRFTEEERNLLVEALNSSTVWHNLEVERAESEYRQKLEADGVEFIAIDAEPFRKLACERIPPQFEKVWKPGLYERISAE